MSLWSRIERRLEELADGLLPDDFRADLKAAEADLEAGRARAAAERTAALLVVRPDHAGARALHGAALLAAGDARAALRELDLALVRAPDLAEALVARGDACLALDDAPGALQSFRRAVDFAGGDRAVLAAAYRGLGLAHRRTGEVDKAIRELRKAVAEAPGDALALTALAELLIDGPDRAALEAKRLLARAAAAEGAPPAAWLALGRLVLDDGDLVAARGWLERALTAAPTADRRGPDLEVEARVALADVAMAEGDAITALAYLDGAIERAGRRADLEARRGDALMLAGDPTAALAAYLGASPPADAPRAGAATGGSADVLRAGAATGGPADVLRAGAATGGPTDVLRKALAAALAADRLDQAQPLADRLLEREPDAPLALLARGRARLREGKLDEARATFAAGLPGGGAPLHLALAELELAADPGPASGGRAAAHARAALDLQPDDAAARRALETARSRELTVEPPAKTADPAAARYPLALAIARLFDRRPELAALAAEARAAADELDQPLLLTVMGEFSSGKSTFINAFIGEDVAATGVTPTTATINVVKHGRERAGRVVRTDGSVEELELPALARALGGLDAARARAISTVEIRLPLPALEKVSIVDTPGLNSILPEHEEVARGFIARADAVVWLFSAQQAGKASERAALEAVRAEGKRVLGVLNKVDQLDAAATAEATGYVARELEGLVERVVPISARQATERRGEGGNFPALLAALEEGFFAHAREIKWQAVSRRLGAALARARREHAEHHARARASATALAAGAVALRAAAERFVGGELDAERARLAEAGAGIYRAAAREVLELVRPRRLPFGTNTATRADRDYLAALLVATYDRLLDASRARVLDLLGAAGRAALAADGEADERGFEDGLRLVEAQVYDRGRAYLRGYLDGGYVDHFFRIELPRLELSEDAIYHALWRASPDLDEQIALPLARAGAGLLSGLAARLEREAAIADLVAFDLEVGWLGAIDALDRRREELG